jgi:Flp pilus assembly pilin Flp
MARSRWARACAGERGAAGVEYALLIGLIAVLVIGTVAAVGDNLGGSFGTAGSAIEVPEDAPAGGGGGNVGGGTPGGATPGGGNPSLPGPPAGGGPPGGCPGVGGPPPCGP